MGLYHDRVLPFLIHLTMSNRQLVEYRRRTIAAARGLVLEIGIGSGLNLPLYGQEVSAVYGLDPSSRLLRRAVGQNTTKAALVEGSAETIPFDNATFDTVVTTERCARYPTCCRRFAKCSGCFASTAACCLSSMGWLPTQPSCAGRTGSRLAGSA